MRHVPALHAVGGRLIALSRGAYWRVDHPNDARLAACGQAQRQIRMRSSRQLALAGDAEHAVRGGRADLIRRWRHAAGGDGLPVVGRQHELPVAGLRLLRPRTGRLGPRARGHARARLHPPSLTASRIPVLAAGVPADEAVGGEQRRDAREVGVELGVASRSRTRARRPCRRGRRSARSAPAPASPPARARRAGRRPSRAPRRTRSRSRARPRASCTAASDARRISSASSPPSTIACTSLGDAHAPPSKASTASRQLSGTGVGCRVARSISTITCSARASRSPDSQWCTANSSATSCGRSPRCG